MFLTFWFDYTCALLSCLLTVGYFLVQLRNEKPPPGCIAALSATILVSLLFFVAVFYQYSG